MSRMKEYLATLVEQACREQAQGLITVAECLDKLRELGLSQETAENEMFHYRRRVGSAR